MNLDVIFNAIVPDNIKSLELVKICSKIFIEQLNRNSTISRRISKIFDVDSTNFIKKNSDGSLEEIKDSKFLKETKNNLKYALFQVYLNVLYNLVEKLQTNSDIKEVISLRNYDESVISQNLFDILTSEYLGGFRYFQQNSGTKRAIRYIYQFSKYLETGYLSDDLKIDDTNIFFLKYNGSLHKRFFSNFNQQLSHPCGWCYEYETSMSMVLEDYFGIKITNKLKYDLNIKTNDNKFIVFSDKSIEEIRKDLSFDKNFISEKKLGEFEILEKRILKTDTIFDVFDFYEDYDIFILNKKIERIDVFSGEYEAYSKVFLFDDKVCLYYDGKNLFYGDIENIYETDKMIFLPSTYHLNIGTDDEIQREIEILYTDELEIDSEFLISHKKGGFYLLNSTENKFKLSGEEYPFVFGIDESRHYVKNYEECLNNFKSFECTFDYNIESLTYLKVYDDFNHNYTLVQENGTQLKFNTHNFYNENLNIVALSKNDYFDYYLKTDICNRISNSFRVLSLSFVYENYKYFLKVQLDTDVKYQFRVLGKSDVIGTSLDKMIKIDTTNIEKYSDFSLILTKDNDTVTISSNCLNNIRTEFNFNFPIYNNINIKNINYEDCTPLTMLNINSSGKTIGELNSNLKPLEFKNGSVVEPLNYYEMNSDNTDLCTFINEGFKKVICDNEDNIIASSTKYVDDEFECYPIGNGYFLTFDNDKDEGSDSLGKFLITNYNVESQNKQGIRGLMFGNILTFSYN